MSYTHQNVIIVGLPENQIKNQINTDVSNLIDRGEIDKAIHDPTSYSDENIVGYTVSTTENSKELDFEILQAKIDLAKEQFKFKTGLGAKVYLSGNSY